ncbi:MAG: TonB-dependent receptor plug domain-containing protein [Bacteroidetes bacterium]|nr:TonB-dependent receptor plug domain-containing protein [Bacteroidota bacterium]
MNEITFQADKFPVGLAMVTLFDQKAIPRCERLVYFHHSKRLSISMKFDKTNYCPREKIKLHILTLQSDSIPVQANLSLAVVNDQILTMANDKQHNILSWLMLGSEVRGHIEKPSYYFDTEETKAEQALDYLLLTQGWRRYNWDDILNKNYNVLYPADQVGCISGTLRDKRTNEPVKGEVIVMELQNRNRILKVSTGVNGKFKFLNADATAHLQILASSKSIAASDLFIEVDHLTNISGANGGQIIKEALVPEIVKTKAREVNRKNVPVREDKLQVNNGNVVVLEDDLHALEEIVVVGYGTRRKADITASITTIGRQELNISPGNINQALQGRVGGIYITNERSQPVTSSQITIRGATSISRNEPLYVVDGVACDPSLSGNGSALQNIPLSNIESISVLKDAAATSIYGCRGINGVILINTKYPNGYFKSVKKNITPRYTGLLIPPRQISLTKEFAYPIYKENEVPAIRDDFRSTIYWNADIQTNNAGEANVEFYASDEITSSGQLPRGLVCRAKQAEKKRSFTPINL